jgi:type IV pilus secretin PilQ/predicted competence protein
MTRRSGSGVVRWSIGVAAAVALAGCARPVVVTQEPAVTAATSPLQPGDQADLAEANLPPAEAQPPAAPSGELPSAAPPEAPPPAPLEVREIKLIEDNGQQGLFTKLSHPPAAVTHYTLTQPNRLIIDIAGAEAGGHTTAQKFSVKNPLISEIRVTRHEGKIRLTVMLRGDALPSYTVNDLNDTVVAFLGEPNGGNQAVREQLVFTRRAVETAQLPPAGRETSPQREPASALAAGDSSDGGAGIGSRPGKSPAYYGQHVSLDFKDADVHNVLRLLAEVSKLNIVATEDVHGKVTLRLFDVPWDQALDIILQVLNLESEQEGNVIRISTVRRLREEREELQKAQEAAKAVEPLQVAYIRVNYAKAAKLAEIISGAARTRVATTGGGRGREEEEGVLTNRGSVFVDEFSNTLVVRDIQRGIDNARELVRRLDVQIPQVLIESNIVEATTDFARDLGIQWGYKASIGPQTGTSTGANFPGMIGIGGSGLGGGATGIPFIADFPAATVAPGLGSALDLALGSINGANSLDARLTALETQGKARIISRPRVVTLNNVAATIKSITILRVKLPSTGTIINTGAGGAAGTASTATEKIETGIVLVVTPQVSADGFVLLDMFAKSSQADFTRTVDQIPTEIAREANSHILIKNGQTVVLGGIYRDNFADTQSGLPFLNQIPGFSWLFKATHKSDSREDLLVFLTPRIMGEGHGDLPSAEELWKHRDAGTQG